MSADLPPQLAIVVPCYNAANRLAQLIPGLEAIRHDRIEVVFVDDGSSDDTLATLERLRLHCRSSIVRCAENRGPGAARNAAFAHTAAEYLWFVDSDDRIIPAAVERKLDVIAASRADVVFFKATCGGEALPSTWSERLDMAEQFEVYGSITSKLFRRAFLDEHQIRFAETYSCEDNYFIFQCAERQRSALFFEDVIYDVVLSTDSLSRGAFNPRFISRWEAVEQILAYARKHPRAGLDKLERGLVFLSLGLTWSYYLERGSGAQLVSLIPRFIAILRRQGLLQYLSSFYRTGSAKNRLVKRAAFAAAWPLSWLCSSDTRELVDG